MWKMMSMKLYHIMWKERGQDHMFIQIATLQQQTTEQFWNMYIGEQGYHHCEILVILKN